MRLLLGALGTLFALVFIAAYAWMLWRMFGAS